MFTKRREEVYLSSSKHFLKNLAAGTLEDAKFIISNRMKHVTANQYFTTTNLGSQKVVLLTPGTNINRKHNSLHEKPIRGVIGIVYDGKYRSEVVFLTNRFRVDEYGNPDTIDDIVFFGTMGEQRLGEMLPMDFIYTSSQTDKQR